MFCKKQHLSLGPTDDAIPVGTKHVFLWKQNSIMLPADAKISRGLGEVDLFGITGTQS